MRLQFLDHPIEINKSRYDLLKAKLVKQLLSYDEIISVYQMGSVRHPGISDLDLICVFKNGSTCHQNLRLNLNQEEKNILTHGIFGVEEKNLTACMGYTLISNLKLLGGHDLKLQLDNEVDEAVKKQVALEYLVKMLITIDAQITLRIVKLRAFLLLAKAIEFDLQLLNINDGELYRLVQEVIEHRTNWFIQKPDTKTITQLVLNFNKELNLFLKKELNTSTLYLPKRKINLPGNFVILQDNQFSIKHKGIVLPNQFALFGKKYINLQNRLNRFTYLIPFLVPKEDSSHHKRFEFGKEMVEVNKNRYPYFLPLTTSLSIH